METCRLIILRVFIFLPVMTVMSIMAVPIWYLISGDVSRVWEVYKTFADELWSGQL